MCVCVAAARGCCCLGSVLASGQPCECAHSHPEKKLVQFVFDNDVDVGGGGGSGDNGGVCSFVRVRTLTLKYFS